jgi:hypothetical protein
VDKTGLNSSTANHAVITQKFWVWNKRQQAFAQVVRLDQNKVPHRWLLNSDLGGDDHHTSDYHQHSGLAQIGDLHTSMSQANIMTLMINRILLSCEDYRMWLAKTGDTLQSNEPSSYKTKHH